MDYPDAKLWHEYFLALSTSAAALVGLLFVATSLHLHELANDVLLRRRAQNILTIMMLLFVQALAVLVPQNHILLGAEILALNLVMLYFPVAMTWAMYLQNLPNPILTRIGTILCAALGAVAGASLIVSWTWSLHLVAGVNAIAMFILIMNAWSLMLGIWRTDLLRSPATRPGTKQRRPRRS